MLIFSVVFTWFFWTYLLWRFFQNIKGCFGYKAWSQNPFMNIFSLPVNHDQDVFPLNGGVSMLLKIRFASCFAIFFSKNHKKLDCKLQHLFLFWPINRNLWGLLHNFLLEVRLYKFCQIKRYRFASGLETASFLRDRSGLRTQSWFDGLTPWNNFDFFEILWKISLH